MNATPLKTSLFHASEVLRALLLGWLFAFGGWFIAGIAGASANAQGNTPIVMVLAD